MAKLRAATRHKLPASKFALPAQKKYPIENKSHAINAKARATQQYNKGNLSAGSLAEIRAKANKKLKEK